MDLQHIKEFICLTQHGSFRSAAKALFISQPTLSKHVTLLEEEIGCKLIERSSGVRLTPAGRYFLREATNLVHQVDGALGSIVSGTRAAGSNLVGLSIPDFSRSVEGYAKMVLRARALFEAAHAPTKIEFNSVNPFAGSDIDQSLTLEEVLDAGIVDWMVYIAGSGRSAQQVADRFEKRGLSSFKLTASPCLFIVETDHPLVGKKHIELADLARYPYLCNHYPVCFQESYRQAIVDELEQWGIDAPVEEEYQGDGALDRWGGSCRLGNHIAPAPEFACGFMGFEAQENHTMLSVCDYRMQFDFYIVYRERPDDESFTAFMHILNSVLDHR